MGLFSWFRKRKEEKRKALLAIKEAVEKESREEFLNRRSNLSTYTKHSAYTPPPKDVESIIDNPIYQRYMSDDDIPSPAPSHHYHHNNDSGVHDTGDNHHYNYTPPLSHDFGGDSTSHHSSHDSSSHDSGSSYDSGSSDSGSSDCGGGDSGGGSSD